jgi:hypothetical protein
VFTSTPSTFWYDQARPTVPVAPRAGDVVRVLVEGQEKAVVAFDGRPTLDGNCMPPGGERVFRGSFNPAATLEVTREQYQAPPVPAELSVVGDRYEATFAQPSGTSLVIATHGTAPKTDGGTIGVHSTLRAHRPPCPVTEIKTSIKPPARRRAIRVRADRRFRLGHRPVCPQALPACRVEVKVEPYGALPRLLGLRRYKVEGGSSARARGRLRRTAASWAPEGHRNDRHRGPAHQGPAVRPGQADRQGRGSDAPGAALTLLARLHARRLRPRRCLTERSGLG